MPVFVTVHGVVDHALLRLAGVLGRLADVHAHAKLALEVCARLGASPIAAAVRRDHALLLSEQRGAEARESSQAPAARAASTEVELQGEGEYWTLSGFGELCRLQDNRGLHMLAQLLESITVTGSSPTTQASCPLGSDVTSPGPAMSSVPSSVLIASLPHIPAGCAFVAPPQPGASSTIIDRLRHSRALTGTAKLV